MSVSAAPRPGETDPRSVNDELVANLLPLAKRLAARYRHAGESQEDLEQVACLGLVKAVDRYDPSAGPLVRYAVPTILGELRRHFRDKGWGVHVPRSVQENLLTVNKATERLATTLGSDDPNYALVELGQSIGPAFRDLPARERAIVQLRFFEDLTQAEIAERIGISQMHVSRLLRRALDALHGAVAEAA